jgi:hypothetical protein
MRHFSLAMKVLVLVLGFVFFAPPSVALDIPATMLLKEKAECKQECAQSGNGEMVCETLCSCTVDKFSKLRLVEFQDMKAQLSAENLSATLQSYLATVGAECVGELDRIVDGVLKPKF